MLPTLARRVGRGDERTSLDALTCFRMGPDGVITLTYEMEML